MGRKDLKGEKPWLESFKVGTSVKNQSNRAFKDNNVTFKEPLLEYLCCTVIAKGRFDLLKAPRYWNHKELFTMESRVWTFWPKCIFKQRLVEYLQGLRLGSSRTLDQGVYGGNRCADGRCSGAPQHGNFMELWIKAHGRSRGSSSRNGIREKISGVRNASTWKSH